MKKNSKFTECNSNLKKEQILKSDKVIVNHAVFEKMFSNMLNQVLCDKNLIK